MSFRNLFSEKILKQSGLLENDDIVVSRKDNSYVLTAVPKKTYTAAKKINGAQAMLNKAGAGTKLIFRKTLFNLYFNSWF